MPAGEQPAGTSRHRLDCESGVFGELKSPDASRSISLTSAGQPQQQDSLALTMHPQAQLEAVETVAGPVEKGIKFSTWSRMTGR